MVRGAQKGLVGKNTTQEVKARTRDGAAQTRLKGNRRVGGRSQGGPRSGEDEEEKLNFKNVYDWAGNVTR